MNTSYQYLTVRHFHLSTYFSNFNFDTRARNSHSQRVTHDEISMSESPHRFCDSIGQSYQTKIQFILLRTRKKIHTQFAYLRARVRKNAGRTVSNRQTVSMHQRKHSMRKQLASISRREPKTFMPRKAAHPSVRVHK